MKKKLLISLLTFCLFLFGGISVMAAETEEDLYYYNETPAEKVTIKVTLSADGKPLLAADGKTALANLEVEVPYFDLAKYDLEYYNRYYTNEGKSYVKSKGVVKRPTGLHLALYLLEKYYLNMPEDFCGKGAVNNALFKQSSKNTEVMDVFGDVAYEVNNRLPIVLANQSPGSLYMTNFWGFTSNLNYYVNHKFPLWKEGGNFSGEDVAKTGATLDYILLQDGDIVEFALFSSMDFINSQDKGFAYFAKSDYKVQCGKTFMIDAVYRATEGAYCLTDQVKDKVSQYDFIAMDSEGNLVLPTESNNEKIIFQFEETGTYNIYAMQKSAGTKNASCDPAVATIVVTKDSVVEEPDKTPVDSPKKEEATTEKPPATEESTTEKTETTIETVAAPKTVKLSKTSVTYTGKALKPTVTVLDTEGKKIDSTNYGVNYTNNKQVGKATVTVTFRGNYATYGTKSVTFKILPKNTSVKKLTKGKKQLKVTWNAQKTQTTGYQIQYSTSKKFTSKTTKTVTIKKNKTTAATIKKLKAKKTYYVRIRTYKTVKKVNYVSSWSAVKSIKTK